MDRLVHGTVRQCTRASSRRCGTILIRAALLCAGLITATSQDLAKLTEQLYFSDREAFRGQKLGRKCFSRSRTRAGAASNDGQTGADGGEDNLYGIDAHGEVVKEAESHRTPRPMIVKLSDECKTMLAGAPPSGILLRAMWR